jgi:two-component system, response regulator YesN
MPDEPEYPEPCARRLRSLPVVSNLARSHPWISRALELIEERATADAELDLESVAMVVAVTPSHLSRVFRETTGLRFGDYIAIVRYRYALLRLTANPFEKVARTAAESGYGSVRSFEHRFQRFAGVSPSAYRQEMREWLKNEREA